jgi:RNA polymerase sigma factor (sigma-70 family)
MLIAARDDPAAARAALEHLCQAYRPVVLAVVRRRVGSHAQAEDLTQSFFAALIERRFETRADPLRGRFRSLLLTALTRFLSNAEAARRAQFRGADLTDSLDEAGLVATDADPDPEGVFLRHWALTVVDRALNALREEARAAGKLPLFDALREYLVEAPDGDDYARLAARFGMRNNTLAVAVHRLRQRLRACVRAELAETVAWDVEAELEILRGALGGAWKAEPRASGTERSV